MAFTDEVNAYAMEANTNIITRDEMIDIIRIIASKYPVMRQDDITHDLEEFITNEINAKYPKESFDNAMIKLWN